MAQYATLSRLGSEARSKCDESKSANRLSRISTISTPESLSTIGSFPSSATSVTTPGVGGHEFKIMDPIRRSSTISGRPSVVSQRLSIMSRLKSSISTFSTVSNGPRRRATVLPSDFLRAPDSPERHFIDSIGMVIPGVCDREQCSHPLSHFVITWRLCEPIEYSTALADHGITFSDYSLLLDALANFLDELPKEPKPTNEKASQQQYPTSIESREQVNRTKQQARKLNELLAEITTNLRTRGLAVMICIGSFSLFSPNRFSEAHIQVLHVPLGHRSWPAAAWERLAFVDPFTGSSKVHEREEINVSTPHRKNSDPDVSTSPGTAEPVPHHHLVRVRDRSRAMPLWPNAIPTTKRALIDAHAGRYGVDPDFREYMRASVNSRTNSISYSKFLIEREDNPFVNTRLEYAKSVAKKNLLWDLVTKGYKEQDARNPTAVNRDRYEHNRKLECRKTVEHGSRLRLARFGFRHPIHPPHTPEMTELGLNKKMYEKILNDIDDIRQNETMFECTPQFMCNLSVRRRRTAEDSLANVSEYIRKLNAQQGNVIWTIEKIPGVYDGFVSRGKEWEISVWNGEDPLDLLLQLEQWGIIEKKLDIDDDHD